MLSSPIPAPEVQTCRGRIGSGRCIDVHTDELRELWAVGRGFNTVHRPPAHLLSGTSLGAQAQPFAYLPYGQEVILVQAINVVEATGLFASRYAPERYQEARGE